MISVDLLKSCYWLIIHKYLSEIMLVCCVFEPSPTKLGHVTPAETSPIDWLIMPDCPLIRSDLMVHCVKYTAFSNKRTRIMYLVYLNRGFCPKRSHLILLHHLKHAKMIKSCSFCGMFQCLSIYMIINQYLNHLAGTVEI